jgi:hypothetical protein
MLTLAAELTGAELGRTQGRATGVVMTVAMETIRNVSIHPIALTARFAFEAIARHRALLASIAQKARSATMVSVRPPVTKFRSALLGLRATRKREYVYLWTESARPQPTKANRVINGVPSTLRRLATLVQDATKYSSAVSARIARPGMTVKTDALTFPSKTRTAPARK